MNFTWITFLAVAIITLFGITVNYLDKRKLDSTALDQRQIISTTHDEEFTYTESATLNAATVTSIRSLMTNNKSWFHENDQI